MKSRTSFTPAFHDPKLPIRMEDAPTQAVEKERKERVSIHEFHGGTMSDFLKSQKKSTFKMHQTQFSAVIDRVSSFAEKNAEKVTPALSNQTLAQIKEHLEDFKKHVIDTDIDFFCAHRSTVYGSGKNTLHEIDERLSLNTIPLQDRMNVVRTLAPGLPMCSGGVMTALDEAVQTLRLDGMGLKGVAYRTKAQMVEALIVDHVRDSHTYGVGNEVHYVNQYFNAIAPALGLVSREDPYVLIAIPHITPADMERCIAKTEVGLTPESLVLAMADDFLSKLRTVVVEGQGNADLTGVVGGDQLTALFDRCKSIKASKLNKEFGDVPIDAFVHPTPESDGMEYQLDSRPIGVARHFLDTLQRQELVDLAKTIDISATDSPDGTLKMLGTLLWVDKDGTCEEARLSDLLLISPREVFQNLTKNHGMSTAEAHLVLRDLSEQVLRMTARYARTDVPAAWVEDLVSVVRQGRKQHSLAAGWSEAEERIDTGWSKPVVLLAAKQGHAAALALLCDHGEDANARCEEGYSLATHAATRGHVDVLKILNGYRANLNDPDSRGNVPLMNATVNGHADTVKFLLEAGAEIDRQNHFGMTAVMYAASLGNPKLVSMLIDAKGDLNRRDGAGRSVLQIAMSKLDAESIKRIIDQGVDVRAQDRNGVSAVMYATRFDRPDVLRMLIETEASVDTPDKLGYTALMVSILKNNLSCAHVLVDAKASLNAKNNTGKNALILAVETNNVSAVETLIVAGADLNMRDGTNRDAAMIAADLGYLEIFNKLRAR